MRNWKAEYEAIVGGTKTAEDFSPEELFLMAQDLVLRGSGGWEAKKAIFELIEDHLGATEDDMARVKTYRGDLARRQGNPNYAMGLLLAIATPTDPMARAELMQAISEAHLALGHLGMALKYKTEIMELIFSGDERVIPVDRELYHLGGVIDVRIQMDSADQEIGLLLERFGSLLEHPDLQGPGRAYAFGMYFSQFGELSAKRGDWEAAAQAFVAWHVATEYGGAKALAATRYLYAAWQFNPGDREPLPVTMAMMEYFREHRSELLPTYIKRYQQEYNFVQNALKHP